MTAPLGTTNYHLALVDSYMQASVAATPVVVQDTVAPTITPPSDVTVNCQSSMGTYVNLGTPTVSDVCDGAPTVQSNAPGGSIFGLGVTWVIYTAKDSSNNQSAAVSQKVTVNGPCP